MQDRLMVGRTMITESPASPPSHSADSTTSPPPALRHDLRELLRAGGRLAWQRCVFLLLAVVALLTCAALLWSQDPIWLKHLTDNDTRAMRDVARAISFWGDFLPGSLPLALVMWWIGLKLNSRRWRLAACASLLAAIFGGLAANSGRLTLGRPRPLYQERHQLENRLYGLRLSHHYHGFPSGHAATAAGSAAGLATVLPLAGPPAALAAAGVIWSRLYLKQHFPSDVLVGGGLGVLAGLVFGFAARRRLHHASDRP